MISSPSDFPTLDVEKEFETLVNGLGDLQQRGLVKLERLEKATLVNLQRQLRKDDYHIFHFIGHGGYDEKNEDGVLMLEDENGRGRAVSGRYLGTLLHDQKSLRLAMLNACEGARTSSSDPFSGVAHSLIQKGIPAVIAMQFEITDEAAIVLANEFYGAIADGYPVDASLAEARKAIFAQNNDIEWGTPVLYMRSPDGRIFGVDRTTAAAAAAAGEHVHDGIAHAHAESSSVPQAGALTDLQTGTRGAQTATGDPGGSTIDNTAVQRAALYPAKSRRSIVPWLIGFVGVAALIVTALITLNIIDLSALSGSGVEPEPIAAIGETQIAAGVIAPTDTATPPPTNTVPAVIPTEEVVLIPITGPSDTPTDVPTIEPSPTEEPTATVGPTPIGGGLGTIAFASDRSGNFQIWTIDVDGNNPTQITDQQDGACQPAWSPDGMQLVFISPCTKNQDEYENTALYVINIDGSGERQLTDGFGGDYDPSWAPNDLIVFASDSTNQTSIYTIDPEVGGDPTPLTRNSWNYRPDWSPDGQQIAFVSTRLSPIQKVFTMPHLGEIDPGGERAKEFSRGSEFAYDQPRYSPDGEFLMYKKSVPNSSSSLPDLVGSTVEDRGLKEATIATSQSIGPLNEADYSPDGKWIVFESWPFSTHHIFIMSANGSNKRQVTEVSSFNFDAAWRPYLEP
jgi:hypothetical protein